MQIKKFIAKNMTEALQEVKKEFGSGAIILSAKSIRKSKLFGFSDGCYGVEVTAAIDQDMSEGIKTQTTAVNAASTNNNSSASSVVVNFSERILSEQTDRMMISPAERLVLDSEKAEVTEAISLHNKASNMGEKEKPMSAIYKYLTLKGVNEKVATYLLEGIGTEITTQEATNVGFIKQKLVEVISKMNDKSFLAKKAKRRPEIIAMVGPTGSGKTTGIAKLAAIRKFQDGEDVAIITTDVHRIGGSEQMEIFSRIFNVPFAVAADPDDIRSCLAKWTRMDAIFIDCTGIGRKEEEKLSELKAIINAVPYIDIHLVIPATMREVEMKAVAGFFSTIPFHNIIFSRLDECVMPGSILNFMKDTGYQVSYVSVGSEVPEDMAKAIGTVIAEYLMQDFIPDGKLLADTVSGTSSSRDFYIANKNSDLIHRPDCVWSKRIKKENMIVFSSVSQALRNHYKPCGQCLPSDS